jgi:hypothetical protein
VNAAGAAATLHTAASSNPSCYRVDRVFICRTARRVTYSRPAMRMISSRPRRASLLRPATDGPPIRKEQLGCFAKRYRLIVPRFALRRGFYAHQIFCAALRAAAAVCSKTLPSAVRPRLPQTALDGEEGPVRGTNRSENNGTFLRFQRISATSVRYRTFPLITRKMVLADWQKKSGHKAFAMTSAGPSGQNCGYSWDAATKEAAERDAIKGCKQGKWGINSTCYIMESK